MKSRLEKSTILLGDMSKTDKVKFKVKFNGTREDIQYINNGCPCTKATFDDGYIVGSVDAALIGVGKGSTTINKTVTIYENDGEAEFIAREDLRRIPNPNKGMHRLILTGVIKN